MRRTPTKKGKKRISKNIMDDKPDKKTLKKLRRKNKGKNSLKKRRTNKKRTNKKRTNKRRTNKRTNRKMNKRTNKRTNRKINKRTNKKKRTKKKISRRLKRGNMIQIRGGAEGETNYDEIIESIKEKISPYDSRISTPLLNALEFTDIPGGKYYCNFKKISEVEKEKDEFIEKLLGDRKPDEFNDSIFNLIISKYEPAELKTNIEEWEPETTPLQNTLLSSPDDLFIADITNLAANPETKPEKLPFDFIRRFMKFIKYKMESILKGERGPSPGSSSEEMIDVLARNNMQKENERILEQEKQLRELQEKKIRMSYNKDKINLIATILLILSIREAVILNYFEKE